MTHFVRNGNDVTIMAAGAMDVSTELASGNYVVRATPQGMLYLEQVKSFDVPDKRYGDLERTSARILKTFDSRPNNTGVLLCGEKGSGKTLLAKYVSNLCCERGVPTILVNQCFNGELLNSLISRIDQPCVVFFDEFEKTSPSDEEESSQEQLLTLLDGVYNTRKLFLLTCNEEDRIDRHMLNRPGRIFYFKRFAGLEPDFIEDYIDDELRVNMTFEDTVKYKKELLHYLRLMSSVNFDMLKAIVEEANRYQSPVDELFDMLNVGQSENAYYFMQLKLSFVDDFIAVGGMRDPLNCSAGVSVNLRDSFSPEVEKLSEELAKRNMKSRIIFELSNITGVERDGTIVLSHDDGHELRLERQKDVVTGCRSVAYQNFV